jgi:MFS family permease
MSSVVKEPNGPQRILTRNIWILSLVSLFTDMASEMLYPMMPVYLRSVGFTVLAIGMLEGIAEAVAGLGKAWFGAWSDHIGKRLPFVRYGYGLSALSKPMLAFSSVVGWVFAARTTDRVGKGLRTGARDAMLSAETDAAHKATVFGFHRSLDTLGAVIGPGLALIYLYFAPANYRPLFLIAFIPGAAAILLTLLLKEKPSSPQTGKKAFGFLQGFRYWSTSTNSYRKLVAGLLVFALVNSSDLLLLLRIREAGHSDTVVIGIYIFYNLAYALLAYPLGKLADRIGMKKVMLAGLLFFCMTYAGFAFEGGFFYFLLLFGIYALYAAATEGVAKAWISNVVPKDETGSAIGTYTGFQSIAALLASSWAGAAWMVLGPAWAFGISATVCMLVIFFLARVGTERG